MAVQAVAVARAAGAVPAAWLPRNPTWTDIRSPWRRYGERHLRRLPTCGRLQLYDRDTNPTPSTISAIPLTRHSPIGSCNAVAAYTAVNTNPNPTNGYA